MIYFVYLIVTKNKNQNYISYVGYTKNLSKRLYLHNQSKGAKFTRGRQWRMIYFEKYDTKSDAMKAEYKLKKNYLLRKKLKENYLNEKK
jgi:putative endonuclease